MVVAVGAAVVGADEEDAGGAGVVVGSLVGAVAQPLSARAVEIAMARPDNAALSLMPGCYWILA